MGTHCLYRKMTSGRVVVGASRWVLAEIPPLMTLAEVEEVCKGVQKGLEGWWWNLLKLYCPR